MHRAAAGQEPTFTMTSTWSFERLCALRKQPLALWLGLKEVPL